MLNRPTYRQVERVWDQLHLAILLIPAAVVLQAVVECSQRGIKATIIGLGKFREVSALARL